MQGRAALSFFFFFPLFFFFFFDDGPIPFLVWWSSAKTRRSVEWVKSQDQTMFAVR